MFVTTAKTTSLSNKVQTLFKKSDQSVIKHISKLQAIAQINTTEQRHKWNKQCLKKTQKSLTAIFRYTKWINKCKITQYSTVGV